MNKDENKSEYSNENVAINVTNSEAASENQTAALNVTVNGTEKAVRKKQTAKKRKWSVQEIKRLYHETIKGKITVSVLALVIISLSLLGISSSYLNNSSTNSTLKRNMNATARVSAERVEWEITSYKNLAEDLGMTARLASDAASVEDKKAIVEVSVFLQVRAMRMPIIFRRLCWAVVLSQSRLSVKISPPWKSGLQPLCGKMESMVRRW